MSHATATVAQEAEGALAAQRCVDELGSEWTTTAFCWLSFVELASRHGWKSPACAAFVRELGKRAAG
jgi:hypothetical protein